MKIDSMKPDGLRLAVVVDGIEWTVDVVDKETKEDFLIRLKEEIKKRTFNNTQFLVYQNTIGDSI